MIIDAHVHVFPQEIISNRNAFVAGEPAFGLLYGDPRARMAAAEELIGTMDRDGVAVSVLCGFPWHDPGKARLHNDYILESSRQYPGRLLPLASVDPAGAGGLAEASRALAAGAAGLGEIGAYTRDLNHDDVRPGLIALARLCAEKGCPLLLHTNEPVGHEYPGKSPMSLRGLYELARSCPQTDFQLAHLGGGLFFFELLKKEVASLLSRCVFDTAAAPFLYRPELYRIFCSLADHDRLLFGSDYPLLRLGRYLKDMKLAGLAGEAERKIMGLNARRFWRL